MIPVARPDTLDEIEAALGAIYTKDEKTELERARDYYAQIPPPPKAYPFSRYKAWKVCCALDTLFHDKCAYCESSYQAVDSRDVEHFRPKGGITEAPLHPGYWWLAAKWSNLLPSCPPCNQRRRQLTYDPTKTLEEFDRLRLVEPQLLSGKANSFPLLGNNWIDHEDGDVSTEDPLLINPCERNPNTHLKWIFDWDRQDSLWEAEVVTASLKPRSVDGVEDPYAKASIAIYGLNRAGLVRERMARIKEMQLILGPVADTMSDLAAAPRAGADHDRLLARLNRYRGNFRLAFTAPDRPYAGMARAFTAQFAKEFSQRMSL